MSKKLILHIGPPKTGTTAIQKHILQNRSRLQDSLIFTTEEENDFEAFKYFSEKHQSAEIEEKKFEVLIKSIPDGGTLLLSCEFFSSFSVDELESMKLFFSKEGYDDINVACYIRNPLDITISSIQEMLKKGASVFSLCQKSLPIRYSQLISKLKSVFVESELLFLEYGDETFDIIKSFKEIILGVPVDASEMKVKANVGMSLDSAIVIDMLIGILGERNVGKDIIRDACKIQGSPFVLPDYYVRNIRDQLEHEFVWLKSNLGMNFENKDIQYYCLEDYLELMSKNTQVFQKLITDSSASTKLYPANKR